MFHTLESTTNRSISFSAEFWRGAVSVLMGAIVIGLLVLLITLSA